MSLVRKAWAGGGVSAPRVHRTQRAPQARIHKIGFIGFWGEVFNQTGLGGLWEVSSGLRRTRLHPQGGSGEERLSRHGREGGYA